MQPITNKMIEGLGAQAIRAAQDVINLALDGQDLSDAEVKAGIEYKWAKSHSNRVIMKLLAYWRGDRLVTVMIRHDGGTYRMKVVTAKH